MNANGTGTTAANATAATTTAGTGLMTLGGLTVLRVLAWDRSSSIACLVMRSATGRHVSGELYPSDLAVTAAVGGGAVSRQRAAVVAVLESAAEWVVDEEGGFSRGPGANAPTLANATN